MTTTICRAMILAGALLMAFNIRRYIRFLKIIRAEGDWSRERFTLTLPLVLLCLFLTGYLTVAFAGDPDPERARVGGHVPERGSQLLRHAKAVPGVAGGSQPPDVAPEAERAQ